jgi:hypothetical protein
VKALTIHQPHASLCVTRQPGTDLLCDRCGASASLPLGMTCDDHRPRPVRQPMVKQFETRSWPCPPDLIGQRIAIHAAKREPRFEHVGSYTVCRQNLSGAYGITPTKDRWDLDDWVRLPLGAVVGSAVVAACLPILSGDIARDSYPPDALFVCTSGEHRELWRDSEWEVDLSDQLRYGDFSPGRFAWVFTDAAPTTERCPWCGSDGGAPEVATKACPICKGVGRCDPIPARGQARLWEWQPLRDIWLVTK